MTVKRKNIDAVKNSEKLYGWDDKRIYFYDEDEKEHCINDNPELYEQMIILCRKFL